MIYPALNHHFMWGNKYDYFKYYKKTKVSLTGKFFSSNKFKFVSLSRKYGDNIEDFYGSYDKNIHKLINQNIKTDQIAVEKREKWKDISKILSYIGFGLLIILIGIAYYIKDIKIAFGLIPIIILFLVVKLYKNKIKNKRIYSYWYSQLFPFKVYMSPDKSDQSDTFIHSKIYLIDDQIAYLGSLNFTSSGTKHNYETRIRTEDPNAIQEIKDEIYKLMNHSHLPERDIQFWGSQLYKEPIN